jgi:hypothetical protein
MKIISRLLVVFAVVIMVLTFLGRSSMMGTRYQVTDYEAVNYSENATEADAKQLGEILKQIGVFTGEKRGEVLLRRDDQGTTVSFILKTKWSDPEVVASFQQIGSALGDAGMPKPFTVRLIDKNLNTKNEFVVD